jgi:OOP family OmpA-OmpF porin
MRGVRTPHFVCLTLALLGSGGLAQAADVEGSADHPLLSRVPGSVILQYEQREFDQIVLPTGKAPVEAVFESSMSVEGKVTRINYLLPEDRSTLEAYRQYRDALQDSGFEILWACEREAECGNWFDVNLHNSPGHALLDLRTGVSEADEFYLASRLRRPEGDVYVSVFTAPKWDGEESYLRVRVVETRAMDADLVTVDAEALEEDLERSGHVAIYGVTFEVDSAELRSESQPTLDEMARLLTENSSLSVFIVGHTDGTGSFEHNLDLSQRRADSVVAALTGRGVPASRMSAHGVGPLAPVASNDNEEGRSLNRRVELVKR